MRDLISVMEPDPPAVRLDRSSARSAIGHAIACADVLTETLQGDVLDALAFSILTGAKADPETGAWLPPGGDHAVSAWSISRTLKAPYETVRRRLVRLAERGHCGKAGDGYRIGVQGASGSSLDAVLQRIGRRTLGVHLGEMVRSRERDTELVTAVALLGLGHFVRTMPIAATATGLDLTTALLFMRVYSANIEGLELHETLALAEDPWPDELRAGVTCYRIAKLSGMPYETVRRHIHRLQRCGYCVMDAAGHLVVPAEVVSSPAILGAAMRARLSSQDLAERIERRRHANRCG